MIRWIKSKFLKLKTTQSVLIDQPRRMDPYDNYEMADAKEALKKGMNLPAITCASAAFEKQVIKYAQWHGIKTKNKSLVKIINSFKDLPWSYGQLGESEIKELHDLRKIRNKIAHAKAEDVDSFGKIEEIITRFSNSLRYIDVFEFCEPDYSRFKPNKWVDGNLSIKIDDSQYILNEQDIDNLLVELDNTYRGKVKYVEGRNVVSNQVGFDPSIFKYTIDGYRPFTLNAHDRMGLSDVLIRCLGIYKYSS